MTKLPHMAVADLHLWAADKLGLDVNAPAEQVRAVLLRSLRDDGFVPPPQVHEALRVLQQRGEVDRAGITEIPLFEVEDRLRNEIETLAFEFFRLSIDDRQQRLQELSERCAWNAPLAAWLRRLRKGVFLDPYAIEAAPAVRKLAEEIAELFVFPPAARVVHRVNLLRRIGKERRDWHKAATMLRRDFPKLAALEIDLLDELIDNKSVAPADLPRKGEVVAQQTGATSEFVVSATQPALPSGRARRREPIPRSNAPNGSAWWIVWVAVFVLAGIFRAANSSKPSVPPRNFDQPNPELQRMLREWKEKHPHFKPQHEDLIELPEKQ